VMRYVPKPGFRREAVRSPEVVAAMVAAAERGKVFAEVVAPVDTGLYRSSFRVAEVDGGARLENTAPYAAFVERRARVLSRAVDAIERGGL